MGFFTTPWGVSRGLGTKPSASDVTMFLLERVCLADRACRAHQVVSELRSAPAPSPLSSKCDLSRFGSVPGRGRAACRGKCDLGQRESLWIDGEWIAPADGWQGAEFGTSGGWIGRRSIGRHVAAIASGVPRRLGAAGVLESTPRFSRAGNQRPPIQARPSACVGRAAVGDWAVGRFGIAEPSGPELQGAVPWVGGCCVSEPRGPSDSRGIFAAGWIPPLLSLRERFGAPRDVSGGPD